MTGTLAVAILALVVSLLTLWRTHLAPARFAVTTGLFRFRAYPFRSEDEKWVVASYDLPISVTNTGAIGGIVRGLRLVFRYPDAPVEGAREYVYPQWEIETRQSDRIGPSRLEWLEEVKPVLWMPFVVLPKATALKHLIFEARWSHPIVTEKAVCTLELSEQSLEFGDDAAEWRQVAEWELRLDPDAWTSLLQGTAFVHLPAHSAGPYPDVQPADLHNHMRPSGPFPEPEGPMAPSYLDYVGGPDSEDSLEDDDPNDGRGKVGGGRDGA